MTHKLGYDPTELCAKAYRLALMAFVLALGSSLHLGANDLRTFFAPAALAQEIAK